ncbi:MAG: radical SAM protein [Thermodesulfobacteriota bacterium]
MPDRLSSLYRARIAGERGTIRKNWGGRVSVALAYPNLYRIGMSNLGFQVVYRLLNRKEHVVAERVFLPEAPEMSLHEEGGRGIVSLESLSPLHRFDLVAFSLSFENDYPNVLKILDLARLPLLSEERDDSCPLIMAGGITSFLNPEPLGPFFDLFLVGEAEAALDSFMDLFADLRRAGLGRKEILRGLVRDHRSVYVPSFYRVEYHKDGTLRTREPTDNAAPERVIVARAEHLPEPVAASAILTPETEFADKVLLELGRGCGRACRFCAAGHVYRPPRMAAEKEMLSAAATALEEGQEMGLLAACVSDIPGIERVMAFITGKGGRFSVSSLRADALSEAMLIHLKEASQRTVAIAPESGSERLRRVINKHLSEEQLTQAVERIAKAGDFSVRLYFLIGLPTETREDVEEIFRLVKILKHQLVKVGAPRGRVGELRLSVNCFVPKAFTPFQWFPMEHVEILKEKQKWLKNALRREGGIKVSFDLPKWAYVQSLLSLGDRRGGSILLLAHRHGDNWVKAGRYSDVNPDFFVYRPKDLGEFLPWDFLDHGIRKEHLVREYTLALKGVESDMCRVGECYRCGVCVPEEGDKM